MTNAMGNDPLITTVKSKKFIMNKTIDTYKV